MDFITASDRLTACLTLADIASEAGVSEDLIRKARMRDRDSPSARRPPNGWEAAIARLARRRAKELEELARGLVTS